MTQKTRPLSPHLQVYRLPLNALLSITHRITGVFLSLGLLYLIAWLWSLAAGEATYQAAQVWFSSWLAVLILCGFSFSLFLHLCHGIRHLIWDSGHALSKKDAEYSSYGVIACTITLTLLSWVLAFI